MEAKSKKNKVKKLKKQEEKMEKITVKSGYNEESLEKVFEENKVEDAQIS